MTPADDTNNPFDDCQVSSQEKLSPMTPRRLALRAAGFAIIMLGVVVGYLAGEALADLLEIESNRARSSLWLMVGTPFAVAGYWVWRQAEKRPPAPHR